MTIGISSALFDGRLVDQVLQSLDHLPGMGKPAAFGFGKQGLAIPANLEYPARRGNQDELANRVLIGSQNFVHHPGGTF